MLVDLRVRGLITVGNPCRALRRFHREQLHALPVQQQLEIVGFAQALDELVAVSRQSNLDLVLAVQRKRIADHRAAACADRKAVEVLLLGEVRVNPDGVAAWRTAGTSDRHPADLLRRGDIAIQQRRRQIADRHIVEAITGLVGGQQRGDIDVEREEIADGVLVFGSGEPPDRGRPAGIRMRSAARSSDVSRDEITAS